MKTVKDIIEKYKDTLESLCDIYEERVKTDNDSDSCIKYQLIYSILYQPVEDKKKIELLNRLFISFQENY